MIGPLKRLLRRRGPGRFVYHDGARWRSEDPGPLSGRLVAAMPVARMRARVADVLGGNWADRAIAVHEIGTAARTAFGFADGVTDTRVFRVLSEFCSHCDKLTGGGR